jgi:hypothetical protein
VSPAATLPSAPGAPSAMRRCRVRDAGLPARGALRAGRGCVRERPVHDVRLRRGLGLMGERRRSLAYEPSAASHAFSDEVHCETPYPRQFERGLIEGIARHTRLAKGSKYSVQFIEGKPGADRTCTLVVRRAS